MKRVVRAALATAVAITVGTAAFAVAETGHYPGAKQIPTVVTGSSTTESVTETSAPAVGTTARPKAATSKPTPSGNKGSASVVQTPASSNKKPKITSDAAAQKPDDSHKVEREVVTRKVRDDNESSSDDSGQIGEQEHSPSDMHQDSSGENANKN